MLVIKTLELEKVKSKITTEKGVINPKLLTKYYLDGVLIGVENKKNIGTLLDFSGNKEVVNVLDKYFIRYEINEFYWQKFQIRDIKIKDTLVVVIVAYLAFMAGGYYIKDVAIKYVDDTCNTEYIIETYK